MTDDLTLLVNGVSLTGWTSIRVTRGIERCPSDFQIEMTERFPDNPAATVVQVGDSCQVLLGNDIVVTGYVDRFVPTIEANSHTVSVTGRGKCSDLVDCAAEWPGGQISGTVLGIAQKLAEPYGVFTDGRESSPIAVTTDLGTVGPVIPQFNLILGETPYSIIERICRYVAVLVYEEPDGNLLITGVKNAEASSGIVQGKNVQRASIEFSGDQNYSEVHCYVQSVDTFQDTGDRGNLVTIQKDPNTARHRKMVVIAESGDTPDFQYLQKRALWEIARRFGRSRKVHVTVDSWRDLNGTLWTPNTLVPVSLPALKLLDKSLLISEVTYSRNGNTGTTADLVLMRPEAFMPQQVPLLPAFLDVKPVAPQ